MIGSRPELQNDLGKIHRQPPKHLQIKPRCSQFHQALANGMFIVSLPFAVLRGGYWAIAAMIGIAYICCYTGKILVDCLYELDIQTGKQVRVRDSYVSIAKECFGKKYGGKVS
ncbi:hypothetical protein JTB14_037426 [Gonioctena quinquepunctata]|nr:hypothetical protein JTB14_037426 [Gonioctena quinquepunctata]